MVEEVEGFALLVGADGEVAAGGGQGGVAHEGLDNAAVGAVLEEGGGEVVAELVGAGVDSCSGEGAGDDGADGTGGDGVAGSGG